MAFSYALFLLFPVASLLNGVATVVSLHLRSSYTFIVYLKNLVAADLLVTRTLLPMAASMLPGALFWLRVFACRLSNVIFCSCLYTSIALMGLISLDRFFKTVRPHGKLTTIPNIVLTNQNSISGVDDFCMSLKGPAGQWFHSFVVLLDVGSCRPSGRRQVFSVLFVFLLCFVHFHIVRISFMKNEVTGQYNCSGLWVKILHDSCLWMSTTNICLDPLLYVCLWREYRNQLLDLKNRWISLIRHLTAGTSEQSESRHQT
uniref:G-protein coupled receptors family 1 profile domain-containing protein n=1 Tax=Cynoglossus semilaevis TaxID=244447 RepID=A0A3P8VLF8_CYNSE